MQEGPEGRRHQGQAALRCRHEAQAEAEADAAAEAEAAGRRADPRINDFHGNLQPPSGSNGRVITGYDAAGAAVTADVGGAEYLATWLKQLTTQNPGNTIVTSSGDLIGASPLLSGLFHDEPTIEAFNAMGLSLNGVGNHEFDEGASELLRMQFGGCHATDGCQDGTPFVARCSTSSRPASTSTRSRRARCSRRTRSRRSAESRSASSASRPIPRRRSSLRPASPA